MIRRKDLLKVFFIYVCIWQLCPAQPCGNNPMNVVNHASRKSGLETARILDIMRLNKPTDFQSLMHEYRMYIDCTQMLENGYFKRSDPGLTVEPSVSIWKDNSDAFVQIKDQVYRPRTDYSILEILLRSPQQGGFLSAISKLPQDTDGSFLTSLIKRRRRRR